MWSREFRAGVLFVVVSLVVGSAVRSYRRDHEVRFQDLIASLESSGAVEAIPDSIDLPQGTGSSPIPDAVASGARSRHPGSQVPRPGSIDPNRATAQELEALPGIGPALAARIVADRLERGRYATPDALLRVPGIGRRTLERVRPFLAVADRPDSAR